jgi:quinol monooxygenase YgiN
MKKSLILIMFMISIIGMSCSQKPTAPSIMKKMIIAKAYVKPENIEEFISSAQGIIASSNREPGCLGYQLYQDPVQKTNFIFVESYKDQAAIDAHFAAPYFKEFGSKIAGMISSPTEIRIIDVSGEK